MKKLLLTILTVAFLLSSCSSIKVAQVLKSGKVEQKEFSVQVPFEYRLGLIVLKVNISGEEYDFMLDTGAPNVISTELAEKLEIKSSTSSKVGDSQGQKSELDFAKVDKISIGGIDFLKTGVVIADLKLSNSVACLEVDGFIGSNLMRNAIWKIDYQNQVITITNSMNSLNVPESANRISFSPQLTGAPKIEIDLNGVKQKHITFDTGSNGHISLSKKAYDSIMINNSSLPQTSNFGSSKSGLYGVGKADSSFYIKVPSVSIGDIALDSTVVKFTPKSSIIIGTEFFKNYHLIINWFTEEIMFIKQTNYNYSSLSNFGFSCSNHENKLLVNEINEGMKDLKIGDQVLSVDGTDYSELNAEQWCEIVENGFEVDKNEINVKVLRDDEEFVFRVKKVKIL